MTKKVDVLVIGGGVAGLSAALYTSRENFSTTVLLGFEGSAISLTSSIENFPGFETQDGNALIEKMTGQVTEFGAETVYATATKVDTSNPEFVTVETDIAGTYEARSVFIATGAVARLLGFDGEKEHYGRGVSTCATCDGFFYKNQHVVVVGGGDTAIEDSLFLNKTFNSKVDLFVRGDKFRTNSPDARKLLALAEDPDTSINVHFGTKIESLEFEDNGISRIVTDTGVEYNPDGLFVAIGRDPATAFLKDSTVPLNDEGYIITVDGGHRVEGEANSRIWAAGDVVDVRYSQAITASGDAAKSAIEIRTFLNSESS